MRRAGLLAALVWLAAASPAAAFSPPEVFVRAEPWASGEPMGDWAPLASAPAIDYLGGYAIGYRLQSSPDAYGAQRVALAVTGVPDGQPTQPYHADVTCQVVGGNPGDVVELLNPLQFEGDGVYTVKVTVGPRSGGDTGCLTDGVSTTASFSVVTRVAPEIAGVPTRFRVHPLTGDAFSGVRAAPPAGGLPQVSCALDATVRPDGSLAGRAVAPPANDPRQAVSEEDFPRPGAWQCVARGTADGLDANFDDASFATPWSPPLAVGVRTDFRRRQGRISHPAARRPRLTFTAEWPDVARGGPGTLALSRRIGCRRHKLRLRRVATYRGKFGAKGLALTIRRPARSGFYLGRLSFSGTPYVLPGTDPTPVLLEVAFGRLGFATPGTFPGC